MTPSTWAEKKASGQTCPQCAEQYGMGDNGDIVHVSSVVRLLHQEHQRSVRIVKRFIRQYAVDRDLIERTVAQNILAALQRGRTGRGR